MTYHDMFLSTFHSPSKANMSYFKNKVRYELKGLCWHHPSQKSIGTATCFILLFPSGRCFNLGHEDVSRKAIGRSLEVLKK